jgi:hypothetical protein
MPRELPLDRQNRGFTGLIGGRSVGPQVSIETRFGSEVPKALVDANQLELVILNLALNARSGQLPMDEHRLGCQSIRRISPRHRRQAPLFGGLSLFSRIDWRRAIVAVPFLTVPRC